jgi:uncharacterized protein
MLVVDPKMQRTEVQSRRTFIKRSLATVAVAGTFGFEAVTEKDRLVLSRTDVFLPHWPSRANGKTVGILSDFHVDYPEALERTQRAVSMMRVVDPEIVILGGDYVSNHRSKNYLRPAIESFLPLVQPGRHVIAIMGNHDWWGNNVELASEYLRAIGITVLRNNSVSFPGVDGAFIVGLDDGWLCKMDVKKALVNVPADSHKLVLLHEPDFADNIGPGFDLQISGHSHGGQIRLPGLPVLHAPRYGTKYPEGLQQAENHLVYTTRGIGMIGPQIRTFCPPEVTLLTLRTGASLAASASY